MAFPTHTQNHSGAHLKTVLTKAALMKATRMYYNMNNPKKKEILFHIWLLGVHFLDASRGAKPLNGLHHTPTVILDIIGRPCS